MNTPGFNCRITLRLGTDKAGRKTAHYWSAKAFRWIQVNRTDAERWIVQGTADAHAACATGQAIRAAAGVEGGV